MKINFDELFGLKSSDLQSNYKSGSHISQVSTSYGLDKSTKLSFKEPFTPTLKQQESLPVTLPRGKQNQTMRILQSNKSNSTKYSWYKETRFDNPQTNINPIKQKQVKQKILTKKQVNFLADRLNKKQGCNNRGCIQATNEENKRKMQQDNLPLGAKRKHQRTLSQTVELIKMYPSQLHQKLYRQHKTREFRNLELALEYEQKRIDNNQIKIYDNQEYTENYVSFYQRLEEQIEKRDKRRQYYDKNIIINQEIITFQPNITASGRSLFSTRKKPAIKPKKQTNQIKGRAQMKEHNKRDNQIVDRLNRSFQSTLNKSVEIVKQKQESSILKILSLFEQNGYFVLRPQLIQQLKQAEFQILLPLIIKMEKQQTIPIEVFQAKLRKYFDTLPKVDKFTLRECQKQRQRTRKIKIRQTQTIKTDSPLSQLFISKSNKRSNKKQTDYLDKLRAFI